MVETPGAAQVHLVSNGVTTDIVVIRGRGWERSSDKGGRWMELEQAQLVNLVGSLTASSEAECVRAVHGRLRAIGTRTIAGQRTWELADDGSGQGGMKGTWFLSPKSPYQIIGFRGAGPAGPNARSECGSPGPGLFGRAYTYEVAPPVTVPPEVVATPTP